MATSGWRPGDKGRREERRRGADRRGRLDRRAPVRAQPPVVPTRRQLEIMVLVARGLSQRAVADAMGIRTSTVKHHLDDLRDRLGCTNTIHTLAECVARGWLVINRR